MYRKAWQFVSTLPAEKRSQLHNPGLNTALLVEHAYNPIHRRYQYDPAGELVRTLDKLRGEINYQYEANSQLHSRDLNAQALDKVKDNRIKQWRDQHTEPPRLSRRLFCLSQAATDMAA